MKRAAAHLAAIAFVFFATVALGVLIPSDQDDSGPAMCDVGKAVVWIDPDGSYTCAQVPACSPSQTVVAIGDALECTQLPWYDNFVWKFRYAAD